MSAGESLTYLFLVKYLNSWIDELIWQTRVQGFDLADNNSWVGFGVLLKDVGQTKCEAQAVQVMDNLLGLLAHTSLHTKKIQELIGLVNHQL